MATAPISNAKNALNERGGFPSPDIAIEIVNEIESVVVKTKIMVASKNRNPNIVPNGNCSAIAIIAAGGPASFKAVDTEPGVSNSWKIPVPPTTVNQNVAMTGAIIATAKTSSRMVLPREIRAVKMAIIVAYPINHAKKNTVYDHTQPS